jgi:hypothetical protein
MREMNRGPDLAQVEGSESARREGRRRAAWKCRKYISEYPETREEQKIGSPLNV